MKTETTLLLSMLFMLLISSCESGPDPIITEIQPIKAEHFFDENSGDLIRVINYSYNSNRLLVEKTEEFVGNESANKRSEFFYDVEDNLMKMSIHYNEGNNDPEFSSKIRTTDYTYKEGLLFTEKTYIDTLTRGYEQKIYSYTREQLDFIEYIQYSAYNKSKTSYKNYFLYNGSNLIEKGIEQNGVRGVKTQYQYSKNGLLTKEYSDHGSTIYIYSGNKIVRSISSSGEYTTKDVQFFYSGNLLTEKRSEFFSLYYSEDPNKPYFIEQAILEYEPDLY